MRVGGGYPRHDPIVMAGSFDPLVGGFIGHDETTGALANSPSMSTKHGVK